MNKFSKKLIIFTLTLSFICASVVCCCLSRSVHAEDPTASSGFDVQTSHCKSHNSKTDHASKNHECKCPKLQGTLVKNFDLFKPADMVFSFTDHNVLAVNPFFGVIPDLQLVFYDRSPPQLGSNSLPFYLKYSVLRI